LAFPESPTGLVENAAWYTKAPFDAVMTEHAKWHWCPQKGLVWEMKPKPQPQNNWPQEASQLLPAMVKWQFEQPCQ
jgi:hypothetical protein